MRPDAVFTLTEVMERWIETQKRLYFIYVSLITQRLLIKLNRAYDNNLKF